MAECAGCPGHCCKNDMIVLHPELGDFVPAYDAEAITHPLTGQPAHQLRHKPNGDCIYFDGGCTIYERRPAICRKYDCGDQFARMSRAERRLLTRKGMFSKEQIEQGRRVWQARQAATP